MHHSPDGKVRQRHKASLIRKGIPKGKTCAEFCAGKIQTVVTLACFFWNFSCTSKKSGKKPHPRFTSCTIPLRGRQDDVQSIGGRGGHLPYKRFFYYLTSYPSSVIALIITSSSTGETNLTVTLFCVWSAFASETPSIASSALLTAFSQWWHIIP